MEDKYDGKYITQNQFKDANCKECGVERTMISDGGYWFCTECGSMTGIAE